VPAGEGPFVVKYTLGWMVYGPLWIPEDASNILPQQPDLKLGCEVVSSAAVSVQSDNVIERIIK
jgi:hypothetical protein